MKIHQVEEIAKMAVEEILPELDSNYIRFAYYETGQPSFPSKKNIVFIWAEESNDDYSKQSETILENNTEESGLLTMQRTIVYLIHFTAYGRESSEYINRIKSGILKESVRSVFASSGLFYIPRLHTPTLIHENKEKTEWRQRWDWQAEFNFMYTETENINYIRNADISVLSN